MSVSTLYIPSKGKVDRIYVSKSKSESQHRSQHSKHISHEGEGSGGDRGVRVALEYA